MAIWQHQIFILPKEELDSYFSDSKYITISDFDNINWWKFRTIDLIDIDSQFSKLLNSSESWDKNLIIYGDNDKDCIQVLLEDNIPVELSSRFDIRNINKEFINILIDFALEKDLAFLSDLSENKLKIIQPIQLNLIKEISDNNRYLDFFKNLGISNANNEDNIS